MYYHFVIDFIRALRIERNGFMAVGVYKLQFHIQ